MCKSGYLGEFCQERVVDESRWLYTLMIFAVIIALIVALLFTGYYFMNKPRSRDDKITDNTFGPKGTSKY